MAKMSALHQQRKMNKAVSFCQIIYEQLNLGQTVSTE